MAGPSCAGASGGRLRVDAVHPAAGKKLAGLSERTAPRQLPCRPSSGGLQSRFGKRRRQQRGQRKRRRVQRRLRHGSYNPVNLGSDNLGLGQPGRPQHRLWRTPAATMSALGNTANNVGIGLTGQRDRSGSQLQSFGQPPTSACSPGSGNVVVAGPTRAPGNFGIGTAAPETSASATRAAPTPAGSTPATSTPAASTRAATTPGTQHRQLQHRQLQRR